ncbi:NAD-binding protein [Mesorhizobium calcicola]|uniref:NAD-binding protein n=1 Tax=Mesorhizobium calcicola TaxID=1300310 RepID=A0ABW4WH95_9HYPH
MGGFASSRVLEVHGERMIARTFAPGFRIRCTRRTSIWRWKAPRALGVALPNTATAQQLMNACSARADGAEADHSSLVQALEMLSDHELSNGKE